MPPAVRTTRFKRSSSPPTKRAEDLQNVGLSITALTSVQLESKGVEQFFDYGNSVPNLSFAIDSADGSLAARGIALRGIQVRIPPASTSTIYRYSRLSIRISWMWRASKCCADRRAPSTARESMGGTVRIITEQPNATAFSGQMHVGTSGTEHGSQNGLVEGDVNLPLIDNTLAVRASGFYQFDSGYFDKGLGPEDAPPTSVLHHIGSLEYYGGQVALRWEPTEGLAITPRVMYQQTVEDGVPYALGNADNLLQRQVFDVREGGTDKWWLDSLTINYTAPFGTFVSSTAYFDRKTFETEDDTDFTAYAFGFTNPLASPITREIDLRRFVQELRFASTFSGPFQTIVGAFYSESTRPRDYEWNAPGFAAATDSPSNLILAFIDSRKATEEAVFGDVSLRHPAQSQGNGRGAMVSRHCDIPPVHGRGVLWLQPQHLSRTVDHRERLHPPLFVGIQGDARSFGLRQRVQGLSRGRQQHRVAPRSAPDRMRPGISRTPA